MDQLLKLVTPEAAEDELEAAECRQQRRHPRSAETEAGNTVGGGPIGHDQSLDLCGGGRGAVALAFELEQAAVEVPAELEKAGQVEVGEQPADAKVVGVVEGGLGPERPSLLVIPNSG